VALVKVVKKIPPEHRGASPRYRVEILSHSVDGSYEIGTTPPEEFDISRLAPFPVGASTRDYMAFFQRQSVVYAGAADRSPAPGASGEYQFSSFLAWRYTVDGKKKEGLVKWKGYPFVQSSWTRAYVTSIACFWTCAFDCHSLDLCTCRY